MIDKKQGNAVRSFLLSMIVLLGAASCAAPPPYETYQASFLPSPAQLAAWWGRPPAPGRLTLSNFSYDRAHVIALVTSYPDCVAREGTVTSDFVLPLNGTRIIETPPGSDVCWRREIEPADASGSPRWGEWSRDYTATGRSIDARL